MEKQPDKMQVLLEWFLGDSKEITDKMQEISGGLAENAATLEEAGKTISAAIEASKMETIAAQRELAASLKQASNANAEFARKLAASQAAFGSELKSRMLIYTVGGSLLGGAVGAVVATLLAR
ncbi:plasmid stabilization protein StbC [Escherichia coli]